MEAFQSMIVPSSRSRSRRSPVMSKAALIVTNPVLALSRFALVILLTGAVYMLIRYTQDFLIKRCEVHADSSGSKKGLDKEERCAEIRRKNTLIEVTLAFVRVLVILVGTLVALWQLGVQSGALFTFAGIISLVVGLAAQNTLRDIMSGIVVLMENQMNVGDIMDLTLVGGMNSVQGTLDHMTLRMLRIRTFDNGLVYIPQGQVLSVTNLSQMLPVVRMRMTISRSVEYRALDDALEEIIDTLTNDETFAEMIPDPESDSTKQVLKIIHASTPFPTVLGIDGDSEHGYDVMIRFVTRFNQQWTARRFAHAYIMNGLYHKGLSKVIRHVSVDNSKENMTPTTSET